MKKDQSELVTVNQICEQSLLDEFNRLRSQIAELKGKHSLVMKNLAESDPNQIEDLVRSNMLT